MVLSVNSVKALITALGSQGLGNEVATAINNGSTSSDAVDTLNWQVALVATATGTSTTTGMSAIAVGDIVVSIKATAGNPVFGTAITAGTIPFTPANGDLIIALRAFLYSQPENSAVKL